MIKRLLAITVATTLLSACVHPYKIDVQQGNIITQDMVDQLKPGMSEPEVISIMGSPVLVSAFSDQRFDYVYTSAKGHNPSESNRLTLYFENHKLTKIIGTVVPRQATLR